jgi:hypothetical protein
MVTKIWLQLYFIALAFAHPTVGQSVSDPPRIEVYITPYYNSDGPVIEVGRFSKGLAAKIAPEFVETILTMKRSWSELRFPEMYVAAIRLYDLGFRNESTYWFYSAQYRGRLCASLVDQEKMGSMGAPAFELVQVANAFQQLAGPYINGYAFGNVDRLVQIVERVQKENKTVPALEKLYPGVIFKRQSEWNAGNESLNEGLTKLLKMLKDQKTSLKKTRVENGTEAKFSKLTNKEFPPGPTR